MITPEELANLILEVLKNLDKRKYNLYITGVPALDIPPDNKRTIELENSILYINFIDDLSLMDLMANGHVHLPDTLVYTNSYINRYLLSKSLLGFTSRDNMATDSDVYLKGPYSPGELVWIIVTYATLVLSGDDPKIYQHIRNTLGGPMGTDHIKISNRTEFLEYFNTDE